MSVGKNYELAQAQYDLQDTKRKLKEYLSLTYEGGKEADSTYIYLERIVSKICKRQEYKIKFSGGDPLWHSRILELLSIWITLEDKIGKLISEEFSF